MQSRQEATCRGPFSAALCAKLSAIHHCHAGTLRANTLSCPEAGQIAKNLRRLQKSCVATKERKEHKETVHLPTSLRSFAASSALAGAGFPRHIVAVTLWSDKNYIV